MYYGHAYPLGVELIVGGTLPFRRIVQEISGIVSGKTTAGIEEIDAVIILPGLEIQTEFGVIFCIEFVNGDFGTDEVRGLVVLFEQIYHRLE